MVDEVWSACGEFEVLHGGGFNHGLAKSAVLVIGQTRYVSAVLCQVELYTYLGVIIDRWFLFQVQANALFAKGRDAFLEFYGYSESIFLPFPLQAAAILSRIEGVTLFGIESTIAVPGAGATFNRLQAGWARHLLGFPRRREGRQSLVIAECGWTRRLGTKMLERAVLLKARVQLLPLEHPACALLRVATTAEFETWATSVARIQSLPQLPFRIPDIAETMSADTVAQGRADLELQRKAVGK